MVDASAELYAKFCVLPEGMENFGLYTEVDVTGDLTRICNRVNWTTMRRDATSHIWFDHGVDHFGDFEAQFTFNFSDAEAGDGSNVSYMYPFGLSNANTGRTGITSGDGIAVHIAENGAVDDQFKFDIRQWTGGVRDFFDTGVVRNIGTYYLTVDRIGTAVRLRIYDNPARGPGDLLETLSGVGDTTAYRYCEVAMAFNSAGDPGDHTTGYVENLELWPKSASAELYASFRVQTGLPGSAELYAFFTVPDTYSITGITKDTAGNRLGNCEIALFATEPGNPPTYVFIAAGVSDGNGDYTFAGLTKRKHFVRAQKDGSPSVFDTTDNELVAV